MKQTDAALNEALFHGVWGSGCIVPRILNLSRLMEYPPLHSGGFVPRRYDAEWVRRCYSDEQNLCAHKGSNAGSSERQDEC